MAVTMQECDCDGDGGGGSAVHGCIKFPYVFVVYIYILEFYFIHGRKVCAFFNF